MSERACRICGCVEEDCWWCIALTGQPCFWVDPDLCSACFEFATDDAERARLRGRFALKKANRRRAPGAASLRQHGYQCIRVSARLRARKTHPHS